MNYPTLEQYNEAFQHHQLALTDPELKKGTIATTGLGLPLALCGGFALTYTLNTGSAKYAVRCFHKRSNALEDRYRSISARLKTLKSPYFVDFEFQLQGIKVSGKSYPIVKMAWANGTTLGEFLEQHYQNASFLKEFVASLRSVARYLESQNLAHGDIQPGNVMIADNGRAVRLIDYDGMFVEDLKSFGSAELGHRNFQHPKRASNNWNSTIDRFSFISLDLATRVLEAHPELWAKTQSDGDSILFKANDYADPDRSIIFRELFNRSKFSEEAKNFAAVCKSSFENIPSLEDFLAKRNIPQAVISVGLTTAPAQYISAYPVLDATTYSMCLRYVGDRVELIGRIVEVKQNKTRYGKPYIFINFGPWRGEIVKISIWSEGLEALSKKPDQSWVGKWISAIGLMEPPYRNNRFKYSHLSISITQANQIHIISEEESKFRLSNLTANTPAISSNAVRSHVSSNKETLQKIHVYSSTAKASSTTTRQTPNQAILQAMKASHPTQSQIRQSISPSPIGINQPSPSSKSGSGCLVLLIIGFALSLLFSGSDPTNKTTISNNTSVEPAKLSSLAYDNHQTTVTDIPISINRDLKLYKKSNHSNKKQNDLRFCLSLGNNEDIARCVEKNR